MSDFASVEAEQAVLGSMLIDSRCIREIAGRLRETDFSVRLNQALFSLICDMDRDGQPVDGITVCGAAFQLATTSAETSTVAALSVSFAMTTSAANVRFETVQLTHAPDRGRKRNDANQQIIAARRLLTGFDCHDEHLAQIVGKLGR